MKIPIRNLYYLFSYAWGRFPAGEAVETGVDDCPDVPNLFARLLVQGTNRLLRRGLDRGYESFIEETRAPRGKMLMDRIVKEQTLRRGAVICSFDELTPDVLHNQIIKATAASLARARNIEPSYSHELGLLVRRLGGVSDIRLRGDLFRRVQLSRNTGEYLPLLRLCDLVYRSLLPEEDGAGARFADILGDEVLMSAVFEEFLRNFYRHEQSRFFVTREVLSWDAVPLTEHDANFLPTMETDITLRSAERVIVFDAKFYREALIQRHGLSRIRSGHLYQLLAYLAHTALRYPGRFISGGLIYPATSGPIHLDYDLRGYRVLVRTVDLSRPWREIHSELLRVLDTEENERGSGASALTRQPTIGRG